MISANGGEPAQLDADVTLLALGGASWPRLGSDGGWVAPLSAAGVALAPLAPANAGVEIAWSPVLVDRAAGKPLKNVSLTVGAEVRRGEMVLTRYGIEGGVVYSLGRALRDALSQCPVEARLDLKPDLPVAEVATRLARRRPVETLANHLRKVLALGDPVPTLLRECCPPASFEDPVALARAIKSLPLPVLRLRGLDRAISTAGGVAWDAVDEHLMLRRLPGIFVAGEMLDWDAPTGGYLLQGCLATGALAADGMITRLNGSRSNL
jgi:uncharacterized flavoprotein (TIGR03862 family)